MKITNLLAMAAVLCASSVGGAEAALRGGRSLSGGGGGGCYATGWQAGKGSVCMEYAASSSQCACTWNNCKFETARACCDANSWVNQAECGESPPPASSAPTKSPTLAPTLAPSKSPTPAPTAPKVNPLLIPSGTYTPDGVNYGVLNGLPTAATAPAVPVVAPAVGPGFADQSWRLQTGPTVYGKYAQLISQPIKLNAGPGGIMPVPVHNFYAVPVDPAPGCEGAACANMKQLDNTRLADIDQLAALVTDVQKDVMAKRGQMKALTKTLTDPDAAEAHFWEMLASPASGGQPFNLYSLVKKVNAADFDAVVAKFKRSLLGAAVAVDSAKEAEWKALAAAGKLYAMDAQNAAYLDKREGPARTMYSVGSMVFLERTDAGAIELKPVAVKLQQQLKEGGKAQVYTRDSSTNSAWAQSLYYSLVGLSNWGITGGHLLNWHFIPAALTWTARNHLAPEHPVRVMLQDKIGDNLTFLSLLMPPSSAESPNKTLDATPTVIKSFNDVVAAIQMAGMPTKGNSGEELSFPKDFEPKRQLELNGIDAADFSGKADWWQKYADQTPEWGHWPMVELQQKMWDMAKTYSTKAINAIYANDAAVVADEQLQMWISEARSAGNLKTLKKPETRRELIDLVTYIVYTPLTHSLTNVLHVNSQAFHAANFPTALMTNALPDAAKDYDHATLLANVLPGAYLMQRSATFFGTFLHGPVNDRLIPFDANGEMIFDGEYEFSGLAGDHPVNRAQSELRRAMFGAIKSTVSEYNPGYCVASGAADEDACAKAFVGRISENTSW